MAEDLKNMAPPEGKALVYIVRPAVVGGAVKMPVLVDDEIVGNTWAKKFLCLVMEPGTHVILSKSENKFKMELSVQAGMTYFIEQKIKMGVLFARSKLILLDENKGRKALSKCKLAKN